MPGPPTARPGQFFKLAVGFCALHKPDQFGPQHSVFTNRRVCESLLWESGNTEEQLRIYSDRKVY